MNRRTFLQSVGLLALAGCQNSPWSKPLPRHPNILFIFSDDHSLQTLGAYPSRMQSFVREHKITPNIDRLAEEGALFENSFVCNSICGPSRAAIITGKHSHINGFKDNGNCFNADQWTVAKALRQNGYQTVLFGKWHLGTLPTGFDNFKILNDQGQYYNPDFITPDGNTRMPGYCTDIIGDLTIDWLKNQCDPQKPFFLCSWHKAPHRTWMPHSRYFNFLDGIDIPEPANLFDDYADRTSAAHEQEMTIRDHINIAMDVKVTPPAADTPIAEIRAQAPQTQSRDMSTATEFQRMTPQQRKDWDSYYVPRNHGFRQQNLSGDDLIRWKYQAYMKDYIKCIKAMDENVGRVLDYLKQTGLDKNTIIIYSSDQGFYNGEHGWYDKRWMYEESLRNPLIIKWPGVVKPNSHPTAIVQNIDYAPTILEAAGIDIPPEVQGESIMPLLHGKTPSNWRKSILYTYYEQGVHAVSRHRGVRDRRYKLIEFYEKGEWEFYDLKKDPLEMHNQFDNPAYQGKIQALKQELKRLMAFYRLEESSPT